MNSKWALPEELEICGKEYRINADYRDILEIINYLNNPKQDELIKWLVALKLFFVDDIPAINQQEAMKEMANFISEGEQDSSGPKIKLIDWDQDCKIIIADINKVAGTEVRSIPFLHWWTFLAYFRGIGEGQLSTIVSIRDKLAKRKKLEKWEQDYYRENRSRIDFTKRYTPEEIAERERLQNILDGK